MLRVTRPQKIPMGGNVEVVVVVDPPTDLLVREVRHPNLAVEEAIESVNEVEEVDNGKEEAEAVVNHHPHHPVKVGAEVEVQVDLVLHLEVQTGNTHPNIREGGLIAEVLVTQEVHLSHLMIGQDRVVGHQVADQDRDLVQDHDEGVKYIVSYSMKGCVTDIHIGI